MSASRPDLKSDMLVVLAMLAFVTIVGAAAVLGWLVAEWIYPEPTLLRLVPLLGVASPVYLAAGLFFRDLLLILKAQRHSPNIAGADPR